MKKLFFRIKKAYAENLKFVLEYLKKLICNLQGKIVITADHGEAFGEKGVLGHPYGVHIRELVEVPWFTVTQ